MKKGLMKSPKTGIILAGGSSSRMGFPKGLLTVDGEPMIRKVHRNLNNLCDEVIVIANSGHYDFLELPVYEDIIPAKGPASGIHTGLSVSQTSLNLIMPCDMPFIAPKVLKVLEGYTSYHQVIFPECRSQWFPVCGFYDKALLPLFHESLLEERLSIRQIVSRSQYQPVSFPESYENVFQNINTPQDLNSSPSSLKATSL